MSLALVVDIIPMAGASVLYGVNPHHCWRVMAGFWVVTGFIPSSFIPSFGTMSADVGGHTKQITAQGIIFVCRSVGSKSL